MVICEKDEGGGNGGEGHLTQELTLRRRRVGAKERVRNNKHCPKMIWDCECAVLRLAHRENQSAEAAAINTVCKPRRPAGGFFVLEFAPISLTKPFRKERCCLDSSILFGKVL